MSGLSRSGLIAILVFMVSVAPVFTNVNAWCPATHIYIADWVFPECEREIDLWYGSIAPDIEAWVVEPEKWPMAFRDTHYNYIDLGSYEQGSIWEAFAWGWMTHNEKWGADYYAHVEDPFGTNRGYIERKARELHKEFPEIKQNFAHWIVEIAVDFLIKNDDPTICEKLLKAAVFRSPLDQLLLVKVMVWKEGRTDWGTLASAELAFRIILIRYARALALSSPDDKQALVELGAQLARDVLGMEVTLEELMEIFDFTTELCEDDYKEVVARTIDSIRAKVD